MSESTTSGIITGITASGEGCLLHDGRLLSFSGVVPGDTVAYRLTQSGKTRLGEVVSYSKDRVKPDCQFHGPCGGCSLLGLSERARKLVKSDLVQRTIRSFVPADQKVTFSFFAAHKLERYRPRIRLHQARTADIRAAGFLPDSAWEGETRGGIIPITGCALLVPSLARRLKAICRALADIKEKIDGLHLLGGAKKDDMVSAHIVAGNKAYKDVLQKVSQRLMRAGNLSGVSYGDTDGSVKGVVGSVAIPGLIATGSPDGPFLAEPSFFCQGNPWQNEKMIREVVRMAAPEQGEVIFEGYAGAGNFTIPLAQAGGKITACESHPGAVRMAKKNVIKANLQSQINFLQGFAEASYKECSPSCVVLDPPRKGVTGLTEMITSLNPEKVVYVSCNMDAMARDGKLLVQAGYRLSEVSGFDLYPRTHHVEAVAKFSRIDQEDI